jgi:acyl-coenzyme A synthetase/AMP-(fatty) acid ligase
MNIVDPILFQCTIGGGKPAICVPGIQNTVVSYSQLGAMIENMTATLRAYDFCAGQVVGVYVEDRILHFVLTLALIRLGLATVSCRGRGLPKELNARAVFVDRAGPVENAREVYVVEKNLLGAKANLVKGCLGSNPVDDSSFCRLVLTSGSTGIPKAVAISHSQVMKRVSRFHFSFGARFSQCLRVFCDLGLTTSLGFLVPVFCLMRGGLVYFYGDDGLGSLQALNLYRIQTMITSAYNLNHYVEFLEQHTSFAVDLDHLIIGGSTAHKELIDRAWSRICSRIIGAYGATEVGVVASSDVRELRGAPGAVGFVHPTAKVEIVDQSGAGLGPNMEGRIRIKSAEMATQYYGDPTASAQSFRDGWFYPGDVGSLRDDGLLILSGRDEFIINIGGDKMKPDLIEETLLKFPGVADAAVAARQNSNGQNKVHGFIVSRGNVNPSHLIEFCKSRLPPAFVPADVIFIQAIPRNEMGKIDRARLLSIR